MEDNTKKILNRLQLDINDLHKRGLLEAGEYMINIDW
jgi:hypothetical protein